MFKEQDKASRPRGAFSFGGDTLIEVYDRNLKPLGILENAYAISYAREVNAIWQASFSLPLNDPKVDKVELLQYVEITDGDDYIGLFRIIPKLTTKNETTESVTFQCEHVLATLLDSSLFKYHQLTGPTTKQAIEYILNNQNHKHWQVGDVELTRYFHYSWENENLLSALFSIPRPFDEQYMWTWDTTSYPWTLNLIRPEIEPTCRIKEGYNLRGFTLEENPMSVFNRIYPLGAGEGVNQLTIESVNDGVPYLEDREPNEEIKETVWVDKRYTDAESLKENAQALLNKWKKPIVTWRVDAADVSKITGLSVDKFRLGKVVRLDIEGYPTTDLRIMKESKADLTGNPGSIQLEIGNVQEDLATTQTDMERRQKVNELYSQGATNIMTFGYQDNCDNEIPAVIPFYVDDDVVNVNTIELTFRTKPFRAYSQATKGGGKIVRSTSSGGGVVESTSSGGGTSTSTASGGSSTQTSSSGGGTNTSTASGGGRVVVSNYSRWPGQRVETYTPEPDQSFANHTHMIPTSALGHDHNVELPSHTHNFSTPNHTHTVSIPAHKHDVEIPSHTHKVTVPNHRHDIELPNHTHEVEHKIVELNTMPSKLTIKVDGSLVPYADLNGDRINIVDYMEKDENGRVIRGRHEVTIQPNGLARIEADLILRVFIQSQLGEVL